MRMYALLVSLTFSVVAFAAPPLKVSVEEESVVVRGATAAGSVLLIGHERDMRGYEPVFRSYERVLQADSDGRVELPRSGGGKPHDSFWVAVDLATGAYDAAVPHGVPARGGSLPPAALVRGHSNKVAAVTADSDYARVLVIRPGAGVWRRNAGDGAFSDADGVANGRVEIAVKGLAGITTANGPGDELAAGDLVLIFPMHRMTFLAGRVEP